MTQEEQQEQQRQAYEEQHRAEYGEFDYIRKLLEDALVAITFNLEYTKVIDQRHQSDFFNLNTNAAEEIKRYLTPDDKKDVNDPDYLPF